MNEWRENLHPRGGDSKNAGRFSAGHGGGRHYNPPPGQEHLAAHHEVGGKRLALHDKTHMYPSVTHWHAEKLRAAVIARGTGRRANTVKLDRLIKLARHYSKADYESGGALLTQARKNGDIIAGRLKELRGKMQDDDSPFNALDLLKRETDRVNNEGHYRPGIGGMANKRGTDEGLLEAFEENAFRVDPRAKESQRIISRNSFLIDPVRARAKKWLLGAVNFNIHHTAMSVPMFYHYGNRPSCGSGRGNLPYHHRRPDGSSPSYSSRVPRSVDMGTNSLENSYIHEYGHAIEGHSSEANELCVDFLRRRRTPGEKLKKLSDLPPSGPRKFHPSEVGFDDKFARVFRAAGYSDSRAKVCGRYTGKDYGTKSTEVLSMGLELLHKNPAAFARADPEWFNLVVGIITGNSLVATRHNLEEDRHENHNH